MSFSLKPLIGLAALASLSLAQASAAVPAALKISPGGPDAHIYRIMVPIQPNLPVKYVPPDLVVKPIGNLAQAKLTDGKTINILVSTYQHKVVQKGVVVHVSVLCSYSQNGISYNKVLRSLVFVYGGISQVSFTQNIPADWQNLKVTASGFVKVAVAK